MIIAARLLTSPVFFYLRYNSRGFDLNRNFPDYFKQNNKRSQPETEAVKEWLSKIQFVLSGNIHGGALVASYPFDNTPNSIFSSVLSSPSLTPDDDTFKHLATTYSLNHGRMYLGDPCKVLDLRNSIVSNDTKPFYSSFRYQIQSPCNTNYPLSNKYT
jgi:hypothetical protein